MQDIGKLIFFGAAGVGAIAAAIYLGLLVRKLVISIRHGSASRPMLVNYAGLAFGLALPFMVLGIVMWGGLPWWVIIPFRATRSYAAGDVPNRTGIDATKLMLMPAGTIH